MLQDRFLERARHARPWATVALATIAAAFLATSPAPAAAQVGLATLRLGALPVTLVYPTEVAVRPVTQGPFTIEVAPDAAPRPGRHRLVVLSHGTGGSPAADHALASLLARAGFVVAQPLHPGDNHLDVSKAGPSAWATRPQDVRQVIDGLAADPRWQRVLELDRVGVHGMSAGGVTALSLAGARWRTLELVRHCQVQAEKDFGFCFNGVTDPAAQAKRRAQFDAARGVPEVFLPADLTRWHGGRETRGPDEDPRPDPRVAAVTVSVPVAAIFSAESLARLRVPVGVVNAGRDTMLLPELHAGHVLRHCTRSCRLLADLPGAAHMDLLWPWPASVARETAALHPRGGGAEPGFNAAERDAAFRAIVAFHRQQLGD